MFLDPRLLLLIAMEASIFFIYWCHISISWKKDKIKVTFLILFMIFFTSILAKYNGFSSINMFLYHGALITSVSITFRKRIYETFSEFIYLFSILSILQFPIVFIVSLFLIYDDTSINSRLIMMFTLLVASFTICKLVPLKNIFNKYNSVIKSISFLLVNLVFLVYIFNILFLHYDNFESKYLLLLTLIIFSFIVINIGFVKFIIDFNKNKALVGAYKNQDKILEPIIKDIKSKQHDFKNHLTTIYGFCQNENSSLSKSIKEYIKEMNTSIKDIDIFLHSDNKVLGAAIYSKLCRAAEYNIDFNYKVPHYSIPFPFKNYEYISIITNLLDNAIEAVRESENEKSVFLRIGQDGNTCYIEIGNNGKPISYDDIPKIFKRGYTTKQNKTNHGFGLYNVKKIVKKYKGNIEVINDNGFTIFRITFNLTE